MASFISFVLYSLISVLIFLFILSIVVRLSVLYLCFIIKFLVNRLISQYLSLFFKRTFLVATRMFLFIRSVNSSISYCSKSSLLLSLLSLMCLISPKSVYPNQSYSHFFTKTSQTSPPNICIKRSIQNLFNILDYIFQGYYDREYSLINQS